MITKHILFVFTLFLSPLIKGQYFDQFRNDLVVNGNIEEIIESQKVKNGNTSYLIKSTSKYNTTGFIETIEYLDGSHPNDIQTITFSYYPNNKIDSITTTYKLNHSVKTFFWKNDSICDYAETRQNNRLFERELFYYNSEQKLDSVLSYKIIIQDNVEYDILQSKIEYVRKDDHSLKQIIESEYTEESVTQNQPVRQEVTLPSVNYIHLYKDGEYRVSQPLITDYQERIRKLDYYRNNINKKESEDHVVVIYNEKGHLVSQNIDNKHTNSTTRIKRKYVYSQL